MAGRPVVKTRQVIDIVRLSMDILGEGARFWARHPDGPGQWTTQQAIVEAIGRLGFARASDAYLSSVRTAIIDLVGLDGLGETPLEVLGSLQLVLDYLESVAAKPARAARPRTRPAVEQYTDSRLFPEW